MAWRSHCPARGPGLRHRHDPECPDGHHEAVCCECGSVVGKGARVPVKDPIEHREYSYDFTDEEAARIDFVAYLVRTGRLRP